MRQQEHIVMKHIDLLIEKLHEHSAGGAKPLNAEEWYNWTTFDITGDLIFGEPFNCLQGSAYHPWVEFIFRSVRLNAVFTGMSYIGLHGLVRM